MMRRACLLTLGLLVAAACAREPSGPPVTSLVVSSPAAGSELLAAEDPEILVSGIAGTTDPHDVLEVWVNGEPVPVHSGGHFSVKLTPMLGVNHIKVEAFNGLSEAALGERVTKEMDVMWVPAYVPTLPESTGFDLSDTIELRLGQRLFDARLLDSDLDLTSDPVTTRDLASMVELVLWHVDLASLLDPSIQLGQGDTTLDVTIPAVTPADVVVDAEIVDDPSRGVALFLDLSGVYLAMSGQLTVAGNSWDVDGGIAADMHAFAQVSIENTEDGVVATVTDVAAGVGPLTPMFTGPDGDELNAFVTLGEHDLRTLVDTLVTDELIPTFSDQLPALFESVLGALNDAFAEQTFELDSGLGDPVSVTVAGEMSALDIAAGPPVGVDPGALTVRQNVTIRTSGTPLHPGSRGAPQADDSVDPPFSDGTGLNLAVRLDLVNALLHAMWNDGLLEGELDLAGTSTVVSAGLPPVVRATPVETTCNVGGERCDVILQIGQLEVAFPDYDQRFVVSATVGARIVIDAGAVSLALQQTPEVRVWEITPPTGDPGDDGFTSASIHNLVMQAIWPGLADDIAGNLSIALPVPDLADLGLTDAAPALDDATLDLSVQQAGVESGFLRLAGDLQLEAPLP